MSLAYFLEKENHKDYLIFESSSEVGGLCKTIRKNDFVFDFAPHLLHIQNEWVINFVKELFGDELVLNTRKAGIWFNEKFIPYPFQYNLYFLDDKIKKECLDEVIIAEKKFDKDKKPENFEEWIYTTLGKGIAKYFMIPYNKKCFCVDTKELTLDFLGKHIPMPSFKEIISGANEDSSNFKVGHYYDFYYSKKGGIDFLPNTISKKINNLNLNEKILNINLKEKMIFTNKGNYSFSNIVSTIPINKLIELIEEVPEEIKNANSKLKSNTTCLILLGIKRDKVSDYHWIYFPQENILPFRISFPTNLSENMAPKNFSSICAEYSYIGEKKFTDDEIIKRIINDLISVGILKNKEEIIFQELVEINPSYVIFDFNREKNLKQIQKFLEDKNVFSISRFGNWEHSSMEDAIIQAKEVAEKIIN